MGNQKLTVDLQQARAVQDQLVSQLESSALVNGIGLTRDGSGWAIKVNLTREVCPSDVHEGGGPLLPEEIEGVPILTQVLGKIIPYQ